jgi:predicted transcriptional regulator
MTSLTIQLDERTSIRLLELSRREHTKPEALVADAVRRRLFIDWLDVTNMRLSQRAKQRGFETEEDFLNAVS